MQENLNEFSLLCEEIRKELRSEITQPKLTKIKEKLFLFINALLDQGISFSKVFGYLPPQERLLIMKSFFLFPEQISK